MNVVEVFSFFFPFLSFFPFLFFTAQDARSVFFLSLMQLWRKIGKEKVCGGTEGRREG